MTGDNSPPELLIRCGEKLRLARDAAGLPQTEVAKRAGMKQAYLSQIERGATNPTLLTLERLAQALGVKISNLIP